jgi:hypothetical protein
MKVSQSLLKGLLDLRNGDECGLIFKAKYIDGRFDLFPPSDVQNLGAWFEYMATGSIPKNGAVPKAEYMKRGKDDSGNPRLLTEYETMKLHVATFKKTMEHYGFEIIRVGEDIKTLYPNSVEKFGFEVWLTGTLDIRARATKDVYTIDENRRKTLVAKSGQIIIIDLKSTGLLDGNSKFSEYSWFLNSLDNKVKLVTQPIHYKYIELIKTGEEPPFLFMLYNTKNPNDARIIDFRVDETAFTEHEAFIDSGVQNLIYHKERGYRPKPSLAECSECPLKDTCEYKATKPPITVFYYGQTK